MEISSKMLTLILNIVGSSISKLFYNQPDILNHTLQTTMTEWNFAHHLANEIAKYIFWLNHDIDVVKRNYSNRRPDIIFHKRTTNVFNFLVIEIKIGGNIKQDITRVRDEWMKGSLNYRFGASISVEAKNNWKLIVFDKKCNKKETNKEKTNVFLDVPPLNQPIVTQIESLVSQILTTKKQNPLSDTTHLEKEIDFLVYKLYNLTEEEIKIIENNRK